jgi:hypothetical protein
MKEQYEGFRELVRDPSLLSRIKDHTDAGEYPAAPGGLRVYWDTECVYNGWKLQRNYYFGHYRILDEYNVKRAVITKSDHTAWLF